MLNRLFLFSNTIPTHRYVASSARHVALQMDLNKTLQCLREVSDKEKSLKLTVEVIDKFGEEERYDQFFVKPKRQRSYAFFDESIEKEKLLCNEKIDFLLKEIEKEGVSVSQSVSIAKK